MGMITGTNHEFQLHAEFALSKIRLKLGLNFPLSEITGKPRCCYSTSLGDEAAEQLTFLCNIYSLRCLASKGCPEMQKDFFYFTISLIYYLAHEFVYVCDRCIYTYIYIHIFTYTYMYKYICMGVRARVYVRARVCSCDEPSHNLARKSMPQIKAISNSDYGPLS